MLTGHKQRPASRLHKNPSNRTNRTPPWSQQASRWQQHELTTLKPRCVWPRTLHCNNTKKMKGVTNKFKHRFGSSEFFKVFSNRWPKKISHHRSLSAKENTKSKKEAKWKRVDPLADIKAINNHARDEEFSADQNIEQSSKVQTHVSWKCRNHHTHYFAFAPSTSTKPNSQHATYYCTAQCTSLHKTG